MIKIIDLRMVYDDQARLWNAEEWSLDDQNVWYFNWSAKAGFRDDCWAALVSHISDTTGGSLIVGNTLYVFYPQLINLIKNCSAAGRPDYWVSAEIYYDPSSFSPTPNIFGGSIAPGSWPQQPVLLSNYLSMVPGQSYNATLPRSTANPSQLSGAGQESTQPSNSEPVDLLSIIPTF